MWETPSKERARVVHSGGFYLPLQTTRTTRFAAAARCRVYAKPLNSTLPRVHAICTICAIWVLHAKPLNPHSLRAPCYMCYMCYMGLTRQAAEPPLSPGSLLYVLYVLYGSYTPSR